MSVTSPQNASHMDFSSNGGNNGSGQRPDLNAFSGGQQNQSNQQDASHDARAPRRWTSGGMDSALTSDETPPTASAATASRIDYRV
jgi:hypothetical protein